MLLALAALAAGIVLLAYAADQFVLGASRLARLLHVPAVVVGVVVVGFGTSLPEAVVSSLAAWRDQLDVAAGNVIGSNLANLSLLLGVGAMLRPLHVSSSVVRRELPLTLAGTAVFAVVVQRSLSVWEGLVMLSLLGAALWVLLRAAVEARLDVLGPELDQMLDGEVHHLGGEALRTLLGLVGTVAGSQLLLTGALDLADILGLAEGFVGATIVAVGTSLPELVTVIQSARRDEADLLVGNVVGSNLFNSLGVGGLMALAGSGKVTDTSLTGFGTVAMLVLTVAVWAMMRQGDRLSRVEGGVLVAGYAVMVVVLQRL